MKYSNGLSDTFLSQYEDKTPPWGPMGYVIYKRTYARMDSNLGRTEEWNETCARVCNGLVELDGRFTESELEYLYNTMFYLRGSVSGRALWQLGTSTVREVGADSLQNCWHVVVNDLSAFTFTFNQLMLGGGVGFNILPRYVYELPEIVFNPPVGCVNTYDCDYIVPDNREGWVELLDRILVSFFFTGKPFFYNTSCVRPKGSPIQGFGGTASGPEDLVLGMKNIVRILRRRHNNKLRPIDAMDIMNIIGEIVVSGNVRRSSEIAVGDPLDIHYLDAKNWGRHQIPNWRTMSNNSVAADTYSEILPQFWDSGYTPNLDGEMEGEPYGLINLKNCRRYGRLIDGSDPNNDPNVVGVNPCITADSWVQTCRGPRQVSDLISENFRVVLNGEQYTILSDGFVFTGTKPVLKIETQKGFFIRCTENHLIMTTGGWKAANELTTEDSLILDNSRGEWFGDLPKETGWLIGNWLGDGTTDKSRVILKWWEDIENYKVRATNYLRNTVGGRSDMGSGEGSVVTSTNLKSLITDLDMQDKEVSHKIELQGSEFYAGFLQGWFDADGTVSGNLKKGILLRLNSSKLLNLQAAQRMLARLGIISTIYKQRKPGGYQNMPGGVYWCKSRHDLVISRDMIDLFMERVGFTQTSKVKKIQHLTSCRSRLLYKTHFKSKVVSVIDDGIEDVYDLTVANVESFNANGIVTHNCAEITLCNREGCNLAEIFLPNIEDEEQFKQVAGILFKACKTISNGGFSDPETHEIVKQNHRIGVGLTGYMQAPKFRNPELLDRVYKHLDDVDREYSKVLGIKMSIKKTTMKPSGTLSLLPGVTPGMHAALARYLLRTVRFSANHPLVQVCRDHGYHVEPKLELDGSLNHDTMVVYFPIETPAEAVLVEDMDVIAELEVQKDLQTYWSDNSVSATHYFEPEDVPRIKAWLKENYDDGVKTTSFLLRTGHGFKQAPYQPISEERYRKEAAKVRPISHVLVQEGWNEYDDGLECVGGHCPVK